jgi:hypothetical protein
LPLAFVAALAAVFCVACSSDHRTAARPPAPAASTASTLAATTTSALHAGAKPRPAPSKRRSGTTATIATGGASIPSGCRPLASAIVAHVRSGLAFPGPGKLERARFVGRPGAYYLAARIVPPGKRASVGTGVWAATTLTAGAAVVAVNGTAAAYSDWRRADSPLSAAARRWVARAKRCVA